MCCDVLLVDTETVTQKAITREEEEEADEGITERQSLGCVREVRPGHCVELTSSLAESGARPAHSEGLYSTSAAHQSLSPAPLPLFSLSQLKKKAYNLIIFFFPH